MFTLTDLRKAAGASGSSRNFSLVELRHAAARIGVGAQFAVDSAGEGEAKQPEAADGISSLTPRPRLRPGPPVPGTEPSAARWLAGALGRARKRLPSTRDWRTAVAETGGSKALQQLAVGDCASVVRCLMQDSVADSRHANTTLSRYRAYRKAEGKDPNVLDLEGLEGYLGYYVLVPDGRTPTGWRKSSTLKKVANSLMQAFKLHAHVVRSELPAGARDYANAVVNRLTQIAPARSDPTHGYLLAELQAIHRVCHGAKHGSLGLYVWAFICLGIAIFARGVELHNLLFRDVELHRLGLLVDIVLGKEHKDTLDPRFRAAVHLPAWLGWLCPVKAVLDMLTVLAPGCDINTWRLDPVRGHWNVFGKLVRLKNGELRMTSRRAKSGALSLPTCVWPLTAEAGITGTQRANEGRKTAPGIFRGDLCVHEDACDDNGNWAVRKDNKNTRAMVYTHENALSVATHMEIYLLEGELRRRGLEAARMGARKPTYPDGQVITCCKG